jgi:hypothetical protein
MAPKIQVTHKKQHVSSRSCSRPNTEDAIFPLGVWSSICQDKSPNSQPLSSLSICASLTSRARITPNISRPGLPLNTDKKENFTAASKASEAAAFLAALQGA